MGATSKAKPEPLPPERRQRREEVQVQAETCIAVMRAALEPHGGLTPVLATAVARRLLTVAEESEQ